MGPHLHDPELLDGLLKHPSIVQDQQTLCLLLATSQATRTALTTWCSGQLPLRLTAAGMQEEKVLQLAAWLKQHAHLVLRLDLQLSDYQSLLDEDVTNGRWSHAVDEVASALHAASSVKPLALQHLSLRGSPVNLQLLAALPVSHLTSLECELPTEHGDHRPYSEQAQWYSSIEGVSGLSQLRQLNISSSGPSRVAEADAYEALTGLQHLSKLQLGNTAVPQLQYLPPNLELLEVFVEIGSPEDIDEFAEWLQEHGHLLTGLQIVLDGMFEDDWDSEGDSMHSLASALKQAAANAGGQLHLQTLSGQLPLATEVYQQVASCCKLTALECMHDAWNLNLLSAMSTMTSLCKLLLVDAHYGSGKAIGELGLTALQQLSSLTCLSKLSLGLLEPRQLQCLPTTLKVLTLEAVEHEFNGPFSLGHLSSVTQLELPIYSERDVLPPNVVTLKQTGECSTLQPLMHLQHLQELSVEECHYAPAEQLLALSTLSSLTSLHLGYTDEGTFDSPGRRVDARDVAAWGSLPIKSLSVFDEQGIPDEVVAALGSLHGLTELKLHGHLYANPDAPSLIDALSSLSKLRILVIVGDVHGTSGGVSTLGQPDVKPHDTLREALSAVIDTLPCLHECYVDIGCF